MGNREQGMGNREQEMGNREEGIRNRELPLLPIPYSLLPTPFFTRLATSPATGPTAPLNSWVVWTIKLKFAVSASSWAKSKPPC